GLQSDDTRRHSRPGAGNRCRGRCDYSELTSNTLGSSHFVPAGIVAVTRRAGTRVFDRQHQ
ncbi:MAG TPA: hypothetical protein VGX46_03295, partial [Vicinamibacterales bacterium]|nr:hypothetical protein [Vicinamibacterales bacterium]